MSCAGHRHQHRRAQDEQQPDAEHHRRRERQDRIVGGLERRRRCFTRRLGGQPKRQLGHLRHPRELRRHRGKPQRVQDRLVERGSRPSRASPQPVAPSSSSGRTSLRKRTPQTSEGLGSTQQPAPSLTATTEEPSSKLEGSPFPTPGPRRPRSWATNPSRSHVARATTGSSPGRTHALDLGQTSTALSRSWPTGRSATGTDSRSRAPMAISGGPASSRTTSVGWWCGVTVGRRAPT